MKPLHRLVSVRLAGWAVSGATAHALLGAISTIILARALDPSGLGAFGIFLAISFLLNQLGELGLGTAYVRLATPVFQRDEDARPLYGTFLSFRLLSVATLGALALLARAPLTGVVGGEGGIVDRVVAPGVLAGLLLAFVSQHHEVLRARLRHRDSAAIRTAAAAARTVAYGALALLGILSVMWAIRVAIGMLGLEAILLWWRAHRGVRLWPLSWPRPQREWLVISGWLFLSSGSAALITHTDTLLLGWLGGPTETGWWVAGSRLIGPVALVVGALWSVILPVSVALDDAAKLARYLRLAARAALLAVAAALMGTVLIGPVIELLFGGEYRGAIPASQWLLAAHGINVAAVVFGGLVLRLGLERQLALVTVCQLAVNTVGDILLIPRFGAAGCAAVSALVMAVGSVWAVTRVMLSRRELMGVPGARTAEAVP